jgi:hypothetical protein
MRLIEVSDCVVFFGCSVGKCRERGRERSSGGESGGCREIGKKDGRPGCGLIGWE